MASDSSPLYDDGEAASAFVELLDALDALSEAFELENATIPTADVAALQEAAALKQERVFALERAREAFHAMSERLSEDERGLIAARARRLQDVLERNVRLTRGAQRAVTSITSVIRRAIQRDESAGLYSRDGETEPPVGGGAPRVDAKL